jgi:hypothetical protein
LAAAKSLTIPVQHDYSLAEIYNEEIRNFSTTPNESAGFSYNG